MKARTFILIALAFVVAFAVSPASAVDDDGIFELEGDALDDLGIAGDDWDSVLLGGGGSSFVSTGVFSDPAPVSIFTQGGSKDINDVSEWRHKDGSVPDKDDITNAYAAAYNVGGDLVVYFGADRFANDGDAQLGFWFFQAEVAALPDGTFSGTHNVGDLLVLANFEGGGTDVTIQILEWVGVGGDQKGGTLQLLLDAVAAECGPALPMDHVACAITNLSPQTAPWDYTPKSGMPGVFPEASFFEGGVNISALFGGGEVPCFASFLGETRSSSSVTAQLKDFVVGSFPVCGIDITKSCDTGELNADDTGFVYGFSGTVTNTGFGTLYDVVVVDDAGTPMDPSDDVTIELGSVGPSVTVPYSGTFESQQNPPTNTVSVTAATTPGGPAVVDDTAMDQCPAVDANPNIAVNKSCQTSLTVLDGLVVVQVSFAGQVENTGDITLDNVMVTDNSGTPDPADDQSFFIGTLAPGETAGYNGTYLPSGVNATNPSFAMFSDTVTATGQARLGFGDAQESATATCTLCQ